MVMIPLGPIGSTISGDKSWDEKGRNMISYIYVTHDNYFIKSIQFTYFHKEAPAVSEKHGLPLSQGTKFEMIRLNHDEYVTGLSGIDWQERITSLTFHTNMRKHGPICKIFDFLHSRKREINVGIRDRREFGGFFGSFSTIQGCLSSIGIYFCPVTSINGQVLRTKFTVTEVTDDDDYNNDDQLTLYQSSDPIATINHNRTLEYPSLELLDGYHAKHPIATINHNRTLEYPSLEFLDGYHAKPIGRKPKLKDRIFSKLRRIFRYLLD